MLAAAAYVSRLRVQQAVRVGVPALTLLVSLFLHLQNLLLNEAQQLCGVGHPQYERPQLHRHSLGSQRLLGNALWVAEERAGIPVTCSTLNRKTKLQSLSFPTLRRHRTCTKAAWRAELSPNPASLQAWGPQLSLTSLAGGLQFL